MWLQRTTPDFFPSFCHRAFCVELSPCTARNAILSQLTTCDVTSSFTSWPMFGSETWFGFALYYLYARHMDFIPKSHSPLICHPTQQRSTIARRTAVIKGVSPELTRQAKNNCGRVVTVAMDDWSLLTIISYYYPQLAVFNHSKPSDSLLSHLEFLKQIGILGVAHNAK